MREYGRSPLLPKNRHSSGQWWSKEFLQKQIVPGTHAYQCPYCGEITRRQKELKSHLITSCRRVPTVNLPSSSFATEHSTVA